MCWCTTPHTTPIMSTWQIWMWWIQFTIKSVYLRIPFLNKSFVILSSARSGSTLLVQYLNCHKSITCHGELLNREQLNKRNIRHYADRFMIIQYIMSRLLPLNPFLPYTGFKLFNEQLEYCNIPLEMILNHLRQPPIIVLYRQNLLELYVSLKIAQMNDIWFSESVVNSISITVDWNELTDQCEGERRRWRDSLRAIPPSTKLLFISYEQLAKHQAETTGMVFKFLGLRKSGCVELMATSLRQNPLPLEQKVSNYETIMERARQERVSFDLTSEWLLQWVNQ